MSHKHGGRLDTCVKPRAGTPATDTAAEEPRPSDQLGRSHLPDRA